MLATALQIIRADELFYWLTPRLERGIATITGITPDPLPAHRAPVLISDTLISCMSYSKHAGSSPHKMSKAAMGARRSEAHP